MYYGGNLITIMKIVYYNPECFLVVDGLKRSSLGENAKSTKSLGKCFSVQTKCISIDSPLFNLCVFNNHL